MSRHQLNESLSKDDRSSAIVKALTQVPLTVTELNDLMKMDIGNLIVEHDLSYPAAERVMTWVQCENLRMDAQSLYTGMMDDYTVGGTPHGSPNFNYWLTEGRVSGPSKLRTIIRKEIDSLFRKRK